MFETLKKLWQECKDAVDAKWDAEHTIKMTPVFENEHETRRVNLSPEIEECSPPEIIAPSIDAEIASLIAEMNRVGIHTTCSCQGHDGGEAYISITLGEGTTYKHRRDIFGLGQDELTLRWIRK